MTKHALIGCEEAVKDMFLDGERASGVFAEDTKSIFPDDRTTLFVCAGIQCVGPGVFEECQQPVQHSSAQTCVKLNALDRIGVSEYLTSFRMLTRLRSITGGRQEMLEQELTFLSTFLGLSIGDLIFQLSDAHEQQPRDSVSEAALMALGVSSDNIRFKPRHWSAPFGKHVATGPNILVFLQSKNATAQKHIWNFEVLEYAETDDGKFRPLSAPLLDSAGNLETACAILSGAPSVYCIGSLSALYQSLTSTVRLNRQDTAIVADHLRTASVLVREGVVPSGKSHGHVLRRLILRCLEILTLNNEDVRGLSKAFEALDGYFGSTVARQVAAEFANAELQFSTRLRRGRKLFDRLHKANEIHELTDFLHGTHGVPARIVEQWAMSKA